MKLVCSLSVMTLPQTPLQSSVEIKSFFKENNICGVCKAREDMLDLQVFDVLRCKLLPYSLMA